MFRKTNFYISVGNTRTSFAFFENSIEKIKLTKRNTKDFFEKINFEEILNELNIAPSQIFVCSVVNFANKKIIEFFKDKKIIFLNAFNQKIINLDLLDNPSEIGNDIIASAIYAQTLGNNVTIASLGTATVISSIVQKAIVGCIILPGLETSYNSLIEKTGIVTKELSHTTKTIGTNTKEALSIGILNGHKAMIRELSKRFHTPNTINIYFGGNAHYIELNDWEHKDDIDLLGLYLFSISR